MLSVSPLTPSALFSRIQTAALTKVFMFTAPDSRIPGRPLRHPSPCPKERREDTGGVVVSSFRSPSPTIEAALVQAPHPQAGYSDRRPQETSQTNASSFTEKSGPSVIPQTHLACGLTSPDALPSPGPARTPAGAAKVGDCTRTTDTWPRPDARAAVTSAPPGAPVCMPDATAVRTPGSWSRES